MKYNWAIMTDAEKLWAVKREMELETHNGTSKDDFIEIMKFLHAKVEHWKTEYATIECQMREYNQFGKQYVEEKEAEIKQLRVDIAQLVKAHEEIEYLTKNRAEQVKKLMNGPWAYNSEQADYIVSKGIADWEQVFQQAKAGDK